MNVLRSYGVLHISLKRKRYEDQVEFLGTLVYLVRLFCIQKVFVPLVHTIYNKLIGFGASLVVSYPSSKNLSYLWNLGSLLAMFMVIQVLTGVLLVFFYIPSGLEAFTSSDYVGREVFCGFVLRIIHLNGASIVFLGLFLHMTRGFLYQSFALTIPWMSGTTIFLLSIGIAFLGYVLPWGQISFWGATVITNLVSTVPILGPSLVIWVWGGFNVNKATLSLFFALHYLLPIVTLALVIVHLVVLHETSSTSKILLVESVTKVKFTPYYAWKDGLNLVPIIGLYSLVLFSPWSLGDPENWIEANAIRSPVHIQPEWYFLFAYTVLRRVPNKLGGVVLLVLRVIVVYVFPWGAGYTKKNSMLYGLVLALLLIRFLVLTWLGSCPVEAPYIRLSRIFTVLFFLAYVLMVIV